MKISKLQVGKRYSKALYEVAQEENVVDEILEDLKALKVIYKENPNLGFALSGNSISATEKNKIMDTLKKPFGELMQNFLSMLVDRKRMDCVDEIADAYIDKYDADNGIVEVEVTSTIELSSDQEDKLKSVIEQRFSVKQVNLTKIVDPSIIGGVIIRVGDQVIDGSVLKRYTAIKNLLLVNN
ncbi:ATP synthase F1 subunit delta [Companilactobacillus sp.]|jgi:F-type H+-transporting ATPase subunit delta|uniref:ATP synthase F1 subunit delta n=1 Tax=Companilactobacillus sp. TaxID=2767905 RepID=UPI0025B872AE|nr:ATP synthase F1 subunit delta [Companilactobacillus sp.]MCH4008483.1 F0F1 ATP synthase subunit delta [Companilactobacillus sp.]MCH4051338.1 F0F1 ATP synthase subunit delta [Companilactobacillus sp.]MCH4076426.1 F0F1 ATP synthase subunit delta [Companilactobacillus sp.]MCH4125001.1 F0F1 ATP synthase subunit delta [Companilactobacillus sp.]MCH4131543.1 F0F1 ATP synthase subunit delta [Companilactobacillus sp.]